MALRRPHRKSRHGCLECKRRRVKCDEMRPACSNCTKRHTHCEYSSSSSLSRANYERPKGSFDQDNDRGRGRGCDLTQGTFSCNNSGVGSVSVSTGSPVTAVNTLSLLNCIAGSASTAPVLNLHDLELMMQWCNVTFHTLSCNERTDTVWHFNVPEEALSHPFLMHGLLAVSALHLAQTDTNPLARSAYLTRAVAHQSQAFTLFREILGEINQSNAKAIFAFASIVIVYLFGFPASPDVQPEDSWTSVDNLYQILFLTRGIQQLIHSLSDYVIQSSFAPIFQVERIGALLPTDAAATIKQLHEANKACGLRCKSYETEIYTATINNIAEMLRWVYGGITASGIMGRWVIRLPARFMILLRERQPMALVMLAYHGVLFQAMRHQWCFGEWSVRVVKAVWAILDEEWRPLVDWPIRAILSANYVEKMAS